MRKFLIGLGSALALGGVLAAPAAATDIPSPGELVNGAGAIARGSTMLSTDDFGEYGCEDFVDAAYGLTTTTGIAHNDAIGFYDQLAAQGLGHDSLPAPTGALVFSQGEDGGHVDISIGNGQYLSGGIQGFAPGWGNGTDIQILPSANLGDWKLVGWAYAPWTTTAL